MGDSGGCDSGGCDSGGFFGGYDSGGYNNDVNGLSFGSSGTSNECQHASQKRTITLCDVMATEEDQRDLQKYFDNINDEGSVVLTIETQMDDDEAEVDAEGNNSAIMDAELNYYFQTSDKMVAVKSIKKESPMKKVSPTVVLPDKIRKMPCKTENTFDSTPKSLKQCKLEDSFKKIIKTETQIVVQNADVKSIVVPIANETLPSENEEFIEEIYEFDESEEDPDNPITAEIIDDGKNIVKVVDYGSKGVIKPIDQGSKSEVKSTKSTNDTSALFTCSLCPYETNKKFLLSRHLKIHSDDRPFKCSVCERGFKTKASLLNHVNTHLGKKPHACTDCEKAFTTSGELVRHIRYRHTHIKPHKCTECDYSSVEMSKLRRHMRCHTGERPYQCPHCTYASPDTFKLKRHLRTHTGEKPYECDICQARFTQSNSLKYHRLIHSVNDKPVFQCHLCPTTCGRKTDLRLHIKKLHSSDHPIACKRCGKELPDRYSYKMHVKTHEGEKCYRCTYCPYASITQRHLESHMLIHTDTKPFECEICNTTFRQKQLLNRHMKLYHTANYEPPAPRKKDHKCPHCHKTFAFNGNLIRHMEAHDPASQLSEEQKKLRIGRMKRVKPDGSVVILKQYKSHKDASENDDSTEEETEEQYEEDEVYEDEYEEEYNELDNIQYIYGDFVADDYEADNQENELEPVSSDKNPYVEIKVENAASKSSMRSLTQFKTVSVKKENDGTEFMALEVDDGQDFMVIEVLPADEEDVNEKHEQKSEPIKLEHITNRNTKNFSEKSTVDNPSDCFGFEVHEDEDDFPVSKESAELLQLIEQE